MEPTTFLGKSPGNEFAIERTIRNQEHFPFVRENRWEFSAKWNSTFFPQANRVFTQPPSLNWSRNMALVRRRKWNSNIPIIPVKRRKEVYLWRYSFFIVKKTVPFDFPPEQPVFPHKKKALQIHQSVNDPYPYMDWSDCNPRLVVPERYGKWKFQLQNLVSNWLKGKRPYFFFPWCFIFFFSEYIGFEI